MKAPTLILLTLLIVGLMAPSAAEPIRPVPLVDEEQIQEIIRCIDQMMDSLTGTMASERERAIASFDPGDIRLKVPDSFRSGTVDAEIPGIGPRDSGTGIGASAGTWVIRVPNVIALPCIPTP